MVYDLYDDKDTWIASIVADDEAKALEQFNHIRSLSEKTYVVAGVTFGGQKDVVYAKTAKLCPDQRPMGMNGRRG